MGKEAVEAVGGKSKDMVMHETEQSACRAEAALFFSKQHIKESYDLTKTFCSE